MQRKQSAVVEALVQVQCFLDEHDALFHAVNATGVRSTLNEVITTLSSQAADQNFYARESRGARAKHLAARRSLLAHHLRAVAGAARLQVGAVPELAGVTAPYARSTTPQLLAAADGMAKAAEQHREVLVRMLGPGFIDQLRAAMQEVQDAFESGRTSRARRAAATAGVSADVARARIAVRVLDALVLHAVAGDAALEREWKSRRKFVATSRSPAEASPETPEVRVAA